MKQGNYHDDFFPQHFGRKKSEIWIRERKSTYCDTTVFKSPLNASSISQIHRSIRKTIETMFSRRILGENNPKSESGVRKSTYCYATDYQPTAQQVKLSLNPLPLLLINNKYIHEVGKQSRRFFPATFWAKIIRNVNLGDENRPTVMRTTPNLPLKKSNWV